MNDTELAKVIARAVVYVYVPDETAPGGFVRRAVALADVARYMAKLAEKE